MLFSNFLERNAENEIWSLIDKVHPYIAFSLILIAIWIMISFIKFITKQHKYAQNSIGEKKERRLLYNVRHHVSFLILFSTLFLVLFWLWNLVPNPWNWIFFISLLSIIIVDVILISKKMYARTGKFRLFNRGWALGFFFVGFYIFVSILLFYKVGRYYESGNLSNLGQYYEGTIGMLLNLATILGVAVAFYAQRRQIETQQTEISENRISNKIQSFENNFYQLLQIQQNIIKQISVVDERTSKRLLNSHAFEYMYKDFNKFFAELKEYVKLANSGKTKHDGRNLKIFRGKDDQYIFEVAYALLFEKYKGQLSNYFRNLFHILKLIFINSTGENKIINEGKLYSNIVRAQISHFELLLLFYNCISNISLYDKSVSYEKYDKVIFKVLVEQFSFFEHLNFNDFKKYGNYYTNFLKQFDKNAYYENEDILKFLDEN